MTRHPGNGAVAPTAKDQGLDGRTWDATTAGTPAYGIKTVWPAGSAQDVAWSITANHGGGYAYRLCPKGGEEGGDGSESEACFQEGHLEFVGDSSWIQYGDDAGNRTAIPAHRTSKGRRGQQPFGSRRRQVRASLGHGWHAMCEHKQLHLDKACPWGCGTAGGSAPCTPARWPCHQR